MWLGAGSLSDRDNRWSFGGLGGGLEDGLGLVFGLVCGVVLGTSTFVLCPVNNHASEESNESPPQGLEFHRAQRTL